MDEPCTESRRLPEPPHQTPTAANYGWAWPAGVRPKHTLLGLLVLAYIAAALWPEAGQQLRERTALGMPLPLALLGLLLFAAGLTIDSRQIGHARRWRGVALLSLVVLWTVPASVVAGLALLGTHVPEGVFLGLAVVAAMPAAASSVAWAHLSRANMTVTVAVLASSTMLSAGGLFFGLSLLPAVAGPSSHAAAGRLLCVILTAVAAGILSRRFLGERRVTQLRPQIKLVSMATVVLLNYANAAAALPQLIEQPGWTSMSTGALAAGAMCATCFASGLVVWRLGTPSAAVGRGLVYTLGMKNTGMALVVAGEWLDNYPLATFCVICYTLIQHLLAAICHARLGSEDIVSGA